MEKLLLIGAGGFGRVVAEHARTQYDCAFVDDGRPIGTLVNDVEVVGGTDDLDKLFEEYKQLIVTIGNNALREKIYHQAAEIGYTFPNIIAPSAYISPYAFVGQGCVILNNAVVQNGVKVGNGVILNPGVELHHDSTVGNNVLIYTNSVIRSLAVVGDRAWIGSTATVSTRAVVDCDAIIEDGAVVKVTA